QALVAGVAAGLGVALVPAHAAKQLPAGVVVRELTGLDLRVTIGMATSGSLSLRHAARSMVELLRNVGARPRG
ncbi:MAG TPA: LysR substrate-binding domain-containing protein, partial [Candidatus Dormibacteraeota bacterium]